MATTTARRGERRDSVMRCAREAIASDGIGNVRLEDIAHRAGMSVGHVMYYFGTRDRLLLETLAWSETRELALLEEELAREPSRVRRAERFVERYLPQQPRDARWGMWFELVTTAGAPVLEADELRAASAAWRTLFTTIVAEGVAAGSFATDPDELAEWFMPYLDGLALEIVIAGQDGRIATITARAVRRLHKELAGASPIDKRGLE
ncbi:MAG: TetR/AcrR family transcriptional regulator [Chloroflexota bacterium]